jgi:hypothetical protein
MSITEPPAHKPVDDLDGLLRDFFRGQMPKSWPPSPVPVARTMNSPRPMTQRNSLTRSRWALAASVALLLLGSLLLPSRFSQDAKPENSLSGAPTIGTGDLRRQMEREHHKRQMQNKNKPGLAVEDDDRLPEMDDSDLPLQ